VKSNQSTIGFMVTTLKVSLGGKAALPKPGSQKARPANALAALGDDEDKTPSTSKGPPMPLNSTLSRSQKLQLSKAQAFDASVYEYDEVYDSMKQGQKKALEARQLQDAERKVGPSASATPESVRSQAGHGRSLDISKAYCAQQSSARSIVYEPKTRWCSVNAR
jgi:Coiled-coil domain-containing protein 55 (DUF2040)